jgi:NAD-dependent SIR2 family protein deacetylase
MMHGALKESHCRNCNYPIWFDGIEWGHYPVNEDGEPPVCPMAEDGINEV